MPIALVMSSTQNLEASPSNGARMVAVGGRELPLVGAHVRADAGGGVARTVVEQRFANPYKEPLSVTYSLPLPADGAVSGFAFVVGGRRIAGEVARRADARATFEQAILEGRSAALLEQERSSVFTQEIGNIPPGETIVAEITVDQPLVWLSEGAWEWRFPTVVAPRYMGSAGRVPDAARLTQDIADAPIAARFTLSCAVRDALAAGRKVESPSHPIQLGDEREGLTYRQAGRPTSPNTPPGPTTGHLAAGGAATGHLAAADPGHLTTVRIDDGARLDRDIVVRWAVATPRVGLSLHVGRPAAHRGHAMYGYGLLTIVPPQKDAPRAAVGRDLIVLLDTSGSMGGQPLDQARRVVSALVDTLGDGDRLEMIEFSSRTRRWRKDPAAATRETKRDALAWLARLTASGGTEMREGILEALRTVRPDAQRQVILVTDGYIGFETEVIAAICDRLPVSSRLHTVGVGSAVNRSLTGPAARAGRGIEVIAGLGEDPERAARRLVAATDRPIVVDLRIEGSAVLDHAPRRLPDLFAGAPVLVGLSLRPAGGEIVVRGRTAEGPWQQHITVDSIDPQSGSVAAVALYGRQAIEDLELALAAGNERQAVDRSIERMGLDFQLATRLTSWVAVTSMVTVDPAAARRRERMPHELPHGMSAEGLGLREASAGVAGVVESGDLAELGEIGDALGFEDSEGDFTVAPLADKAERGPAYPSASIARPASIAGPAPIAGPVAGLAPIAGPVAGPASTSGPVALPPFGGAARPSAPMPLAAPARHAPRKEAMGGSAQMGLPKSRKTPMTPWTLLGILAFGIAYYFTRSWWIALGAAWTVMVIVLVLQRLFK